MEKIYLVDSTAYIFRAYHGIRYLSNRKGVPTNAVFGYAKMLLSFIEEKQPTNIVAVFDAKGKSFRSELYEQYKENRPEAPEDLKIQIPLCINFTKYLGIPVLIKENVEADDTIASLARECRKLSCETVILSADKDLMQLVDENTWLYDAMRDQKYDQEGVLKKYGVTPAQIGDFLALMGDSSDNIPGVKGIGKKTAAKLLKKYENLDNIFENLDNIGGRAGKNLSKNIQTAKLSRQLVALKENLEFDEDIKTLSQLNPPQTEKLHELINSLQLNSIRNKITELFQIDFQKISLADKKIKKLNTEVIKTRTELKQIKFPESATLRFKFDSSDKMECRPESVCIFDNEENLWLILFASGLLNEGITETEFLEETKEYFASPFHKKIAFNHKKILIYLIRNKIEPAGISDDPRLAAYQLHPSEPAYDLAGLYEQEGLEEGFEIQNTDLLNEQNLDICRETARTTELSVYYRQQLKEFPELENLYLDTELPLTDVLAKVEVAGLYLDKNILHQINEEVSGEMMKIEEHIQELAGWPVNINSTKQLQKLLFEEMGLPVIKKTKTGYSTNSYVLEQLAHDYPIAETIKRYRILAKLKNSYLDTLPALINSKTNRIHTNFNQVVAATGRLSSSEPNLQQIPIRTDIGRKIRNAFKAPDGYLLASFDYSQIELRVLAHLSEDKKLMEAYAQDKDIHALTASEIFNIELDQVNRSQRSVAKQVNFGVLYGQTGYGLSKSIGISQKEAREYINKYFEKYPGVKNYLDRIIKETRENGYISTMFGRRRYFNFSSKNSGAVERMVKNTPIQGSAADIIKIAMVDAYREMVANYSETCMVLTIHDELVFEVPENKIEKFSKKIKEIMENAVELKVPLKVNYNFGKTWNEAH
ncbi:MAG: DNA polymerase I [Deltaproteobacteria bacterium]|jgi:DNA polymerase-1|nr:DNA polymerase I [Deltaproteobacteria bacterium]